MNVKKKEGKEEDVRLGEQEAEGFKFPVGRGRRLSAITGREHRPKILSLRSPCFV